MNKRIEELVDRSGFGSYAEIPDTYIVHKNDLAEFAELIVKQCAGIADNAEPFLSSDLIKQHFGVED